jgi:hypothetical protein
VVAGIHVYRAVARATGFRRRCLFAVSCSRHVEAVAREHGAVIAVRAMRLRFANCRPGYTFEFEDETWRVCCVAAMIIDEPDASVHLHQEAAVLRSVIR